MAENVCLVCLAETCAHPAACRRVLEDGDVAEALRESMAGDLTDTLALLIQRGEGGASLLEVAAHLEGDRVLRRAALSLARAVELDLARYWDRPTVRRWAATEKAAGEVGQTVVRERGVGGSERKSEGAKQLHVNARRVSTMTAGQPAEVSL